MLGLITALIFLILFILFYIGIKTYASVEGAEELRLRALDAMLENRTDLDEELARPFSQRIISPLTGSVAARLTRVTPRAIRQMVEAKLSVAGGLRGMGVNEFLLLVLFLGIAMPLLTALLAGMANVPLPKLMGFSLYALAGGVYLPFLMLNRKIKSRRHSMVRDLPDVLDLLTVSVEAGLVSTGRCTNFRKR